MSVEGRVPVALTKGTVLPAYRVHGLVVASEVPFSAPSAEPSASPDVVIRVEDFEVERTKSGRVLLAYDYPNGASVVVTDETGGYLIGYSGLLRILVSHDLGQVRLWAESDVGWALAPALVEGWVMAFVLQLAHHCVLHASAVVFEEGAVAFMGNSGMGKSTTATLLCSRGAQFLADDVLRVGGSAQGAVAYPGSRSARLRPGASELATEVPFALCKPTSDGRLGVTFAGAPIEGPVALRAVLIPWPSRQASSVSVNWLDPRLAVVELSAYPRLYDWRITGPRQRQFAWAAEVATALPVGHLIVPWGPPWPPELITHLYESVLTHLRSWAGP